MLVKYPNQGDMEVPLLKAIVNRGGQVRFSIDGDALKKELADYYQLSQEERKYTSPKINAKGHRRWRNHIQYVRLKLQKKGEIDNDIRDLWRVTEKGYQRLELSRLDPDTPAHTSSEPPDLDPAFVNGVESDVLVERDTAESPSGAGFGDTVGNKVVETAAVQAVVKAYHEDGWAVRSVECDKCGFDLECSKNGAVENVEVKGISGAVPCFIITAGEVVQARSNPNFFIIVVTLALSTSPNLRKYSGAEFCQRFELSAIQYRAILKP